MIAQKHDYNWVFGLYTYPDDRNFNGNLLNFSEDTVSIEVYEKFNSLDHVTTTYSDSEGNLKFWSNGCDIFNNENEVMENGDTLNSGLTYEGSCIPDEFTSYIGGHQAMLSLPDLQNEKHVHVFHKWVPWNVLNDYENLLYTKVNLEANNGLGKVEMKNEIINSLSSSGLLTATKHEDLESWWLITAEKWDKNLFVYNILSDSIIGPKIHNQGVVLTSNNQGSSSSSFSPDGSKYAIFGEADGLRLYDFDRKTGELSNYEFIEAPHDHEGGRAGLTFSASGRFLYTCHWKKIYQYDMWAEDIGASMIRVAEWEESFDDIFNYPTMFFVMERAPDCRIYLSAQNATNTIHVIHHPDRKGEACMVQQNIKIPAYNFTTLPHFPNYRLGTGEVCDSTKIFPDNLLVAVEEQLNQSMEQDFGISLYPNPSTGIFYLEFAKQIKGDLNLFIYDVQGKRVFSKDLKTLHGTLDLDLSKLSKGMYYFQLFKDGISIKNENVVLQ